MGKEVFVETATIDIYIAPNHQCSAADPKSVGIVVVLSTVGFDIVHDTTAAERIAKPVDIATGGASIFEMRMTLIVEQFRGTGSDRGVGIHQTEQRASPPRSSSHIGIEQKHIFAVELSDSAVIATSKAIIAVEDNGADLGEITRKDIETIVGRSIVGHDDLDIGR